MMHVRDDARTRLLVVLNHDNEICWKYHHSPPRQQAEPRKRKAKKTIPWIKEPSMRA